ncbi:6-bisphosphatase class,Fructose-1 [Trichinella spiralis]|uniref:6-bisphosphatase class,Fructose-1 n=1 Tax=Trichinella spiralis TaxID=6334 RepID=A0ABR3K753_TRISP
MHCFFVLQHKQPAVGLHIELFAGAKFCASFFDTSAITTIWVDANTTGSRNGNVCFRIVRRKIFVQENMNNFHLNNDLVKANNHNSDLVNGSSPIAEIHFGRLFMNRKKQNDRACILFVNNEACRYVVMRRALIGDSPEQAIP